MAQLPDLPDDDFILPFQVGETAVRGTLVRLGPSANRILAAHKFPDPVSRITGEAAALVSLVGSSLKFDGKLILQMRGEGPVSMIVADYLTSGAIRATASFNKEQRTRIEQARGPELHYLLAKGHMVMTVDQGQDMDRYQGVTPLEGATLSEGAVNYFRQSEQIPTAIRLETGRIATPDKGESWRAGGMLIQFVPGEGGTRERGEAELLSEADQEDWDNAAALMQSVQADELLDPMLSPMELLYRLYHENGVRVFEARPVKAACGCSREKVANVLNQYPVEDLQDMIEDGKIVVTCDFCREVYEFELEE